MFGWRKQEETEKSAIQACEFLRRKFEDLGSAPTTDMLVQDAEKAVEQVWNFGCSDKLKAELTEILYMYVHQADKNAADHMIATAKERHQAKQQS